jgi:hypothetical protein
MTTTTHHHYTAALYLLAFAGLVWLVAWGWFCFMVGRIVRWTYLEKKAARRSAPLAQYPQKGGQRYHADLYQ